MDKPKPIAEVIVTPLVPETFLAITVSSPDADAWVRENAGEFGELFLPERTKHGKDFVLHIFANYRQNEVAEYIRAMGGADKEAAPSAFADSLDATDTEDA